LSRFADQALRHLARLPREPHLHLKRTLAIQADELLEAEGADPAAVAVMRERHAIELPDRAFTLNPERTPPARDPFVEIGSGTHPLNDVLIEAEVAAATALEVDDATRRRLVRFAADTLQASVDLEEGWGDAPVDVSGYARLMALPAADRVEQLLGEGGGGDEDPAV
jgi:hypothetical protein